MIRRMILKFSLFFKPFKIGDEFFGDPTWWVIPRPIELVLHGLKDRQGLTIYDPIPSDGCFKLTIEKEMEGYYVLSSEVFCTHKTINNIGTWMKRSQPRKLGRLQLEEYFLNGLLWRE